jgi:hypothetical protein
MPAARGWSDLKKLLSVLLAGTRVTDPALPHSAQLGNCVNWICATRGSPAQFAFLQG